MVVVSTVKERSNSECPAIAEFFAERIARAGGTIARQTRTG